MCATIAGGHGTWCVSNAGEINGSSLVMREGAPAAGEVAVVAATEVTEADNVIDEQDDVIEGFEVMIVLAEAAAAAAAAAVDDVGHFVGICKVSMMVDAELSTWS